MGGGNMAGPYVSSATIKTKLADRLHKLEADLDARWDSIITDSIAAAYRDIRARMMNPTLGYTQAQLDAWDDRVSYSVDQTLFWCFVNGAGLDGYSDQDYSKLDHRKELENPGFTMFSGGVIVEPGIIAAGNGSIYSGDICQRSGGVDIHSTFRTEADRWAAMRRGDTLGPNYPS
jgi:hypothetical protein